MIRTIKERFVKKYGAVESLDQPWDDSSDSAAESVRLSPHLPAGLRQRPAVRLNLPNRFDDVIHVPAVRQEQILGHPDRRRADLPIAFQLLEALAIGFQPLGAEETLESARVDRLIEQAVEVL